MKRFCPLLLTILLFAGCRAPMPSFNLLAPYGSTRIPPPATGSMSSDNYYQPGSKATAPVGTGFRARQSSTSLSADARSSTDVRTNDNPSSNSQARLASHETTTLNPTTLVPASKVVESRGPVQIVESAASRSLPPTIRGMRINEPRVEPGRFYPTRQVIDISQLPPATRFSSVVPRNQAIGTSVASRSTNSSSTSASQASSNASWHARN